VIFKDPDSANRSDRTGDWIKVKFVQSDSFFIVGYEKSTSLAVASEVCCLPPGRAVSCILSAPSAPA
jgi:ATP-dependent DNA ligase